MVLRSNGISAILSFPTLISALIIFSDVYLSNRPQVSMVYKLINHAGCW